MRIVARACRTRDNAIFLMEATAISRILVCEKARGYNFPGEVVKKLPQLLLNYLLFRQ